MIRKLFLLLLIISAAGIAATGCSKNKPEEPVEVDSVVTQAVDTTGNMLRDVAKGVNDAVYK